MSFSSLIDRVRARQRTKMSVMVIDSPDVKPYLCSLEYWKVDFIALIYLPVPENGIVVTLKRYCTCYFICKENTNPLSISGDISP